MKLKHIYIILLLAVFSAAKAQPPGFMGKRFLVTANVGPSLAFPFNSYGSDAGFKFKPKLGLTTEYVVNRKTTVIFQYNYSSTKLSVSSYLKDPFYNDFTELGTHPAAVHNSSINFKYARHINGNLPAPLGFYWGHGVGIGIAGFVDKEGAFTNENGKAKNGTYLTSILPNLYSFIGNRRAIGKKLMLGFNMEFNWWGMIYMGLNFDYDPYFSNTGTVDLSSKTTGQFQHMINKNATKQAYYYSNMINLSLDITFLPF